LAEALNYDTKNQHYSFESTPFSEYQTEDYPDLSRRLGIFELTNPVNAPSLPFSATLGSDSSQTALTMIYLLKIPSLGHLSKNSLKGELDSSRSHDYCMKYRRILTKSDVRVRSCCHCHSHTQLDLPDGGVSVAGLVHVSLRRAIPSLDTSGVGLEQGNVMSGSSG
jgi:hypothetical protein